MGQYFKAVNFDKQEFVCPWCIGGVAKLWEWAANPWGAIFVLLLRQSTASGGGDYFGPGTTEIRVSDTKDAAVAVLEAIRKGVAAEGQPLGEVPDTIVGRWAGDRVALVGDYDASGIWDDLQRYRNISAEVVRDWNVFIEIPEKRLRFNPDCCCNKHD
jgi:hypothetical protein